MNKKEYAILSIASAIYANSETFDIIRSVDDAEELYNEVISRGYEDEAAGRASYNFTDEQIAEISKHIVSTLGAGTLNSKSNIVMAISTLGYSKYFAEMAIGKLLQLGLIQFKEDSHKYYLPLPYDKRNQ